MADIVTFDPAYFQELAKDLESASRSLDDANAIVGKACVGLDSGLVAFALCYSLNENLRTIKKNVDGFLNKASGFSKVLIGGVMRVNGWEETTKNRESGLASQLGKTWGFEGGNSAGGAPSANDTGGSKKPKIDLDWTNILTILGGINGLTRAAVENAIRDAIWGAGLGTVGGAITGPGMAVGAIGGATGGAVEGAIRSAVEGQGVEQGAIEGANVGAALDSLENAGYNIFDLINPFAKGESARKYVTEALNK
jgi:hypothetical protein